LAAWRGPKSLSLASLAFGREALRTSPCLSKVKGLFDSLRDLNARIDRASLRVYRPKHTVFLCGGLISKKADEKAVLSVRDYLYRIRQAEKRLGTTIVLAETAQQLYRDTTYNDLISFEEDIARIASIVLVISESPGSLAELGAFASEPVIRETLRIIISEDHSLSDSFVRYGPIKRIESIDRGHLGIFPWRNHKSSGYVTKSSIAPHFNEIIQFIRDKVSDIPLSFSYGLLSREKSLFFDILWLISLLEAPPPEPLYEAVRILHPDMTDAQIRNCLYTLRVCRWIDTFSYSNRDYFYLPVNNDPYEYAFLSGQRIRDVAARKLEIVTEFHKAVGIGRAVLKRLQEKRKGAS